MTDLPGFKERFRSADTPSRLRRLAQSLEVVRDQLDGGATAAAFEARLEETTWMLECISSVDDEEVRVELQELARVVEAWRFEREAILSVGLARDDARDLADAWADRLTWVAGLLEATR